MNVNVVMILFCLFLSCPITGSRFIPSCLPPLSSSHAGETNTDAFLIILGIFIALGFLVGRGFLREFV